jgi:hypothetical protein
MDAQQEACDTYTACANTAQEWIEEAPLTSVLVGLATGLATGYLVGAAMSRHEPTYASRTRDAGNLASRLGSQFLQSMEDAAKSGYGALQSQFGGR